MTNLLIALRMDVSLVVDVDDVAHETGTNRSTVLRLAVEKGLPAAERELLREKERREQEWKPDE